MDKQVRVCDGQHRATSATQFKAVCATNNGLNWRDTECHFDDFWDDFDDFDDFDDSSSSLSSPSSPSSVAKAW